MHQTFARWLSPVKKGRVKTGGFEKGRRRGPCGRPSIRLAVNAAFAMIGHNAGAARWVLRRWHSACVGDWLVHINYYQDQTSPPRVPPSAPPGPSLLRRMSDFVMMVVVGLMTVGLLLGALAGSPLMSGTKTFPIAAEHLWTVTGIGGFLLGLSWRFIFWDLPGMIGHVLRHQRRNLQLLFVLAAGVAVLVLV